MPKLYFARNGTRVGQVARFLVQPFLVRNSKSVMSVGNEER